MSLVDHNDTFQGTERFELRRCLGSGSMGIVYEAWDVERGAAVALKVMQRVDPRALFRFKKEFRALADVSHPHLVTLYELLSEQGRWFFTMELVRGISFLEYVRPWREDDSAEGIDAPSLTRDQGSWAWDEETREGRSEPPAKPAFLGPLDERRLRRALKQLVSGLMALHAVKRLHRDIKPSNVLVTPKGRVVVCDFGLVGELYTPERGAREEARLVGTVNFMSPEQSTRAELTPKSDWYSVGVVLYLALTGSLPFKGSEREVLKRKRSEEPRRPRDLSHDVPVDLDELCMDLLVRDPDRRPGGEEILERLGVETEGLANLPPPVGAAQFVGRREPLKALYAAYADTRDGKPVVALVHGPTGMGKTALVERFLEKVDATKNALVLEGRCYERESMPYKAFDALMDGLSVRLTSMRGADARALLPEDLASMARLFPVMQRLAAVDPTLLREGGPSDPRERRRRGFAAVRELIRRLAERQPVVLYVDDLQWGDLDSGDLLLDLVQGPDAPPILVVLAYRSEEAGQSPLLEALVGSAGRLARVAEVRHVEVDALSTHESVLVATALAGDALTRDKAEAISREAAGSPFLIRELVRYVERGSSLHGAESARGHTTIAEVLEARVKALPSRARRVLEVIAVAGRPVVQRVVKRAAALEKGFERALSLLRAEHLVRTAGVRAADIVETYHDRIRELVVSSLSARDVSRMHEELASALHWAGVPDPEALVDHWIGAGEPHKAAVQAAAAAARANEALAFDRAVRLYRTALDLGTWGASESRQLTIGLGHALAAAGRGPEAAEAFLSSVPGSIPTDALELRRLAAEKLLQSGHFDRGLEQVAAVLADVGDRLPSTRRGAALSFLAKRAWIRVRGYGFREKDASRIAPHTLTRIDTLWSVASGLANIDTIRGMDFQARHVLLALDAGEPYRVARSLAMEAGLLAPYGEKTHARSTRLGEAALALGQRLQNPHAIGFASGVLGVSDFLAGRWASARKRLEAAGQVLRSECAGVQWESDNVTLFELASLYYLGELAEMVRRVPIHLREAEARGDLFEATGIRSWRTNTCWLVLDDPQEARHQLEIASSQWSRSGFHLQHYYELLSRTQIDLYEGNAHEAHARVVERWEEIRRSMLLRVQNVRVEMHHLRARASLAAAAVATGSAREALLVEALRAARPLAREKLPWTRSLARLAEGTVAHARAERANAVSALRDAITLAVQADMGLYAAVARWRLGEVLAGDEGRMLRENAQGWLTGQGVRRPERLVAAMAPGY